MAYRLVVGEKPISAKREKENESPEESTLSKIGRGAARTAVDVAATLRGLPGDILSTFTERESRAFPTSKKLKEVASNATKGYTAPKNKTEEFLSNLVSDVTSFVSVGNPLGPTRLFSRIARAAGISLGASGIGKTAEYLSGSKETGENTRAGAMFALSLVNPRMGRNAANRLYNIERANRPHISMGGYGLTNNLTGMRRNITRGRPLTSLSADERFVINQIDGVLDLQQNGRYSLDQLIAQKRSVNSLPNLFDQFDRRGVRGIRRQAQRISGMINNTVRQAERLYPDWGQYYRAAEDIHGTLNASQSFQRWIGRHLRHLPNVAHLLGVKIPILVTAPAIFSANEAGKLLYKVARSPHLRQLYLSSLAAATAENAPSFKRKSRQLENALKKEEEKKGYKFKL
ncbi:MAG: hypothetical protein KGI50_05265 [Patescibacteria group bacterium]|nr:hypothetical protein [Patescibacteria group bacterium]MDE2438731.1 hypothetical protein [Patescibacteria group bacterium]